MQYKPQQKKNWETLGGSTMPFAHVFYVTLFIFLFYFVYFVYLFMYSFILLVYFIFIFIPSTKLKKKVPAYLIFFSSK